MTLNVNIAELRARLDRIQALVNAAHAGAERAAEQGGPRYADLAAMEQQIDEAQTLIGENEQALRALQRQRGVDPLALMALRGRHNRFHGFAQRILSTIEQVRAELDP